MSNLPTTEQLAVRASVEDLVIRYGTAIDTRDWDLFRSIFAEDAEIDYGPTMGTWTSGAAFTDFMRQAHAPAGPSVHRMTNIVLHQGERLTVRTYVDSSIQHRGDPGTVDHGAAYYDDVIVDTADGLKIGSRKTTFIVFERLTGNLAAGHDI